MKLNLTTEKNITLLSIQGKVDSSQSHVLFAGIKKLLRDGKNKLILCIDPTIELESDHLREIIKLNLIASELAGEIVLFTKNLSILTRIKSFSSPSFLLCFSTKEEALQHFQPKVTLLEEPLFKVKKEDLDDLSLKERLQILEKENDSLYKQLENKIFSVRHLENVGQWEKRLQKIEEEYQKLLNQLTKSSE